MLGAGMVIFGRRGMLLEKAEIVDMRVRRKIDAADGAHALGLGLHAVKLDALVDPIKLDAVQPLEEVELIPGTAKLPVGGELAARSLPVF